MKKENTKSPSEPSATELIDIKSQLLELEDRTPLQESQLEAIRTQLEKKLLNRN